MQILVPTSSRKAASPLCCIFRSDGKSCVGFILRCGRAGFEASDREGRPLGLFGSQLEAADAVLSQAAR